MPATALYAGLLALVFIVLSARVILQRRDSRVPLGDGGEKALLRPIRVHSNFAEYVPLALILMGLAESLAVSRFLLHGLGLALLVGRLLHALGVSRVDENFRLRVAGVATTLTVIAVAALICLWRSLA
jgi:uncharacterized protein